MGIDLLITRKNEPDGWRNGPAFAGLRTMAGSLEFLDKLVFSLGTKNQLREFFDPIRAEADFYAEIHGQDMPEGWLEEQNLNWFDPDPAIESLQYVMTRLQAADEEMLAANGVGNLVALLDDLEACLSILREVKADGDLFCFELGM